MAKLSCPLTVNLKLMRKIKPTASSLTMTCPQPQCSLGHQSVVGVGDGRYSHGQKFPHTHQSTVCSSSDNGELNGVLHISLHSIDQKQQNTI